jgi:peptidoglycan/xylan/chitin deacetylase (PgdA/CDA1 family)
MWTIGSLLLVAFNSAEWLVTFPNGRWRRRVVVGLLLVTLMLSWLVPDGDRRSDSAVTSASLKYSYGLVSWELENVFDKWGHRVWTSFPWTPTSEDDRRQALDRYVDLVGELRDAKDELHDATSASDPDKRVVSLAQDAVGRLISERNGLRDGLEEYLEQIIARTVQSDEVGLAGRFVWPPVDFRIDSPPKLLVTSPRDEIVRAQDVLIDPDISIGEMSRIEAELADSDDISALIIQTGGLASYPNVVPAADLKRLVEVGAHEWLHAYLVFQPLGRAYFGGGDIRSMNETLADIFGREVGLLVYSEVTGEPYVAPTRPDTARNTDPDEEDDADSSAAEIEDPEDFNFNRFMGATRKHTDELLADGLIDEAESYMEGSRVELLDHGYVIRKVNQAYFAFHGTYAESPSSTSPVARYLWDLREQVDSVGELVKLLSPLGTYEDFEGLLVTRGIELAEDESADENDEE